MVSFAPGCQRCGAVESPIRFTESLAFVVQCVSTNFRRDDGDIESFDGGVDRIDDSIVADSQLPQVFCALKLDYARRPGIAEQTLRFL